MRQKRSFLMLSPLPYQNTGFTLTLLYQTHTTNKVSQLSISLEFWDPLERVTTSYSLSCREEVFSETRLPNLAILESSLDLNRLSGQFS